MTVYDKIVIEKLVLKNRKDRRSKKFLHLVMSK